MPNQEQHVSFGKGPSPGVRERGSLMAHWSRSKCMRLFIVSSFVIGAGTSSVSHGQSVAQRWNQALLDAIRIDFPAPTVHSRNLYHTSAAMYDAWSAFDPIATGHFYTTKTSTDGLDVAAARNEAISYAAYRVLSHRYALAVDPQGSQALFDQLMGDLGYDPGVTSTVGDTPAAIGNRIAEHIISSTVDDGSNETNGYVDNTGYVPMNDPMVVDFPSVVTPDAPPLADPNRWQPLFLDSAVTQNDLEGEDLQTFVGPHWGSVTTFAMGRNGPADQSSWAAIDPGSPPMLQGVGDAEYRSDTVLLIDYSNQLDPNQGRGAELINISPNTNGNRATRHTRRSRLLGQSSHGCAVCRQLCKASRLWSRVGGILGRWA